jgi:ABC-type lipoprotein release transport system permease subunit
VLALPSDDSGIGLAAYLVPIAVVLGLIAIVATLLPARRASRIRPAEALRYQ